MNLDRMFTVIPPMKGPEQANLWRQKSRLVVAQDGDGGREGGEKGRVGG